jgi:hypothetical protein
VLCIVDFKLCKVAGYVMSCRCNIISYRGTVVYEYSTVQCFEYEYSTVQCFEYEYSTVQCFEYEYSTVQCFEFLRSDNGRNGIM